jgi:hypothetical protein
MSDRDAAVIRDAGGAPWEKRGNAAWVRCPGCGGCYPVSPQMLGADAPDCCCPTCHLEFRPAPVAP